MKRIWIEKYQKGRNPEIELQEETLDAFFINRFKSFGPKLAFQSMDKAISFNELDILSQKFASFLVNKLHVKKGDRIALMMPNILQFPVAVVGAVRAGAIICPLNPLYTRDELRKVLFDGIDGKGKGSSKPRYIIALNKFGKNIQSFVNDGEIEAAIITEVGDLLGFPKKNIVNFVFKNIKKEVPAFKIKNQFNFMDFLKYDTNFEKPSFHKDDTAILQFTGGTSGTIKAAKLAHRNILSNVAQNINNVTVPDENKGEWTTEDRFLAMLPLFHILALNTTLFSSIGLGYGVILVPNPRDLDNIIKIWSKNKITLTCGVNTLYAKLLGHKNFNSNYINFNILKSPGTGGMAIQEKVSREFHDRTGKWTQTGYGLSETSPVLCMHDKFKTDFSPSSGYPYASTDIQILDENNKELDFEECGEICVKGPQVMTGYWELEEDSKQAFTKDGFFRTGDMGYIGKDGELYIVDRKKDMINVSGFNVFAQEVENVVNSHPDIIESGAISIPSEKTGEAVMLFVVSNNKDLTQENICSFCKEHLTNYKIPKKVQFVDEIPKSPVGKLLRRELKKFL